MSQQQLCEWCGGRLSPGKTAMQVWHGEELVILRDVPAGICDQCGQAQVDATISEKVEQFLQNYTQYRPQRYLQVPEFSAAQVLGEGA